MKMPRLIANVDDNATWWLPCHVELGSLSLEQAQAMVQKTMDTLGAQPFNGHTDNLFSSLETLHREANERRQKRPYDSIPVSGAVMHVFFRKHTVDGWQLGITMTTNFGDGGSTVFGVETFRYLLDHAEPAQTALSQIIGADAAHA